MPSIGWVDSTRTNADINIERSLGLGKALTQSSLNTNPHATPAASLHESHQHLVLKNLAAQPLQGFIQWTR